MIGRVGNSIGRMEKGRLLQQPRRKKDDLDFADARWPGPWRGGWGIWEGRKKGVVRSAAVAGKCGWRAAAARMEPTWWEFWATRRIPFTVKEGRRRTLLRWVLLGWTGVTAGRWQVLGC
jgi:hypothetical protein